MSAPVRFEERAAGAHRIGIATLNAAATLNGLSLAMVDALAARLDAWEADPGMAAVVLRGAGEKAFCAGGDLHALYAGMRVRDRLAVATYRRALRVFLWIAVVVLLARVAWERVGG